MTGRHRGNGGALTHPSLLLCAIFAVAAPVVSTSAQVSRIENVFKVLPADVKRRFGETQPYDFNDRVGYTQIFDGRSLSGWDGDPAVWRVEGGKIIGERAKGAARNNDYLVYRAQTARDFDLKLEIQVLSGGSGIQYRSRTGLPWLYPVPGAPAPQLQWMMTGPQADLWAAAPNFSTIFDGQTFIENSTRGIVAYRGEVTQTSDADKRPRRVGRIGDATDLRGHISATWNQYHIIARGGVVMHLMNGQIMSVHIDDDPKSADSRSGLLGIEVELNPARVEVRNIWLKKLN